MIKSSSVKKYSLIFVCVVSLFLKVTKSYAELIDRIVARVGSEIILQSDLDQAKLNLEGFQKQTQQNIEPTDKAVLQQLINQKLVRQEMNKRGMEPDEADVNSAMASVLSENKFKSQDELIAILKKEGVTFDEYKNNLKDQVRQSRLMNWIIKPRVKKVTEEMVAEKLEAKYPKGRKVIEKDTYLLFKSKSTKNQKKIQAWQKQIKSVEAFKKIAKKESEGPAKDQGGQLGFIDAKSLQDSYSKVLLKLPKNQVSQLIETEQGYALLMYVDEKSTLKKVTETEKAELRAELERLSQVRAFERFIVELRNKNEVDIKL